MAAVGLVLTVATVKAVPVKGGWTTATLADGSSILVLPCGDEHFHFFITSDGRRLTMDADGRLTDTPTEAAMARGNARRNSANKARLSRRRSLSETRALQGERKKGLIILVGFANKKFQSPNTAQSTWNAIANEVGYDNGKSVGSVHDYFLNQSYGLFDIVFDVVGPINMPNTYAYYGKNDRWGEDSNVGELVRDACIAADNMVDFSDYDWNHDGEADMVYILYAGYSEAFYSSRQPDLIWPHEWALQFWNLDTGLLILDDTLIDTYACGSELGYGTELSGLGTFCHEFSHALGLPDLYNTDSESKYANDTVMEYWDLLSLGCYNNDGWCPAGYSAYERYFCGWLAPVELKTDCSISGMKPLNEAPEAYLVRNEAEDDTVDEYYLIENRKKTAWDKYLPGSGVLMTHVDFDSTAWMDNSVNNFPSHYRLAYIPAGDSQSEASAAFPVTVRGRKRNSLTSSSLPAAKVFNINKLGSMFMEKPITNIAVNSEGLASFNFQNIIGVSLSIDAMPSTPRHGDGPSENKHAMSYDILGRPANGSTPIIIYRGANTNNNNKHFKRKKTYESYH